MSVLFNQERTEMIISCDCCCDSGYHFRIEKNKIEDFEDYCFCTVLNGNWYMEQDKTLMKIWFNKLRKIWAILRNKDHYYSEVVMSKKDFEEFKHWIGEVE